MNNLGTNTPQGFAPSIPTAEDIMERLGKSVGGWDEANNSPAGKTLNANGSNPRHDILRCYVQVFSTPAGQRVLDDILNMSIRRSPYMNGEGHTLEQQTAYGIERKGQNGLAIAICKNIVDGQKLPPPNAAPAENKE